MKNIRRGYHEEDETLFGREALDVLAECAKDIRYLLDRGYPWKSVITFTGNHFLLTERQRTALMRMCASEKHLKMRRGKQLEALPEGCTVHIDAFNAVVLMETALSGSMILKGADGCYRDLSGLAGTYSVIQNTGPGVERILKKLKEHHVSKAVFWIDMPVSNSGRLKTLIAEEAEKLEFPVDIRMVKDADEELKKQSCVISGDSEVIEGCVSWYNLYEELIADLDQPWVTDLPE